MGGGKPVDYLHAWSRIWSREYREQIQLVVGGDGWGVMVGGRREGGWGELNPGPTNCKSSALISDLSATLKTRWFTLTTCFQIRSLVDVSTVDWASFVPIHFSICEHFSIEKFPFYLWIFFQIDTSVLISGCNFSKIKLSWQNLREALQGKVSHLILTPIVARVEFWH